MLRLSDFVTCRKRYYNQSVDSYILALEHCLYVLLMLLCNIYEHRHAWMIL